MFFAIQQINMKLNLNLIGMLILTGILFSQCSADELGSFSESENGASGSITRFAVNDGYMYSLNPNQIQTFDLSDPSEPELVHELTTDYGLETIFIYEGNAYLGSRTGLYILGLSNPAEPVILSQTTRGEEFFGGCDPVVVKGNYAFSTIKIIENICGTFNSRSALIVYDVSNLENPVELGAYDLDEPNGLGIVNNLLFVCDAGSDKLVAFDISDPENTQPLPELDFPIENPFDMIVDGDRVIVSAMTDFHILDISDLSNINIIKSIKKGE